MSIADRLKILEAPSELLALNDILNKKTEGWTDVDSAVSKLLADEYEATAAEAISLGDTALITAPFASYLFTIHCYFLLSKNPECVN